MSTLIYFILTIHLWLQVQAIHSLSPKSQEGKGIFQFLGLDTDQCQALTVPSPPLAAHLTQETLLGVSVNIQIGLLILLC